MQTLYVGHTREAGPLPACTMLYAKPSRSLESWVRTEGHVCQEGEIITDSFGRPLYRVTFAEAAEQGRAA